MRSTGKGKSKATRDAQDRAKQITVANDFIEAFSNPAAMLEQIRETLHPSSHIPKARSSFKPWKVNKNNEKKTAKEKPKQKQKRHNDVPPTSNSLDKMGKKARLAKKVIARLEDSNSSDDEDNRRKKLKKVIQENPPVVIFIDGLGIKTCQGCGKAITKEEQMYPSNMIFK